MSEVITVQDLETLKKHEIFEAEVITGLVGGAAGGANIDYATNQVTGQVQKTMPAILRDIGFEPASFDFTTGGILTTSDRNKVVYDPVSKTWYSWSGALPKVVAAGEDPLLDADWVPQTDPNLRTELAAADGASLVGGAVYAAIRAYAGGAIRISCLGRVHLFDGAYGDFRRDDSDTTSADNDGTILIDALGRRWKRQFSGGLNPQWFGGVPDYYLENGITINPTPTDNTVSLQKTIDALNGNGVIDISGFYYTSGTLNNGGILVMRGPMADNFAYDFTTQTSKQYQCGIKTSAACMFNPNFRNATFTISGMALYGNGVGYNDGTNKLFNTAGKVFETDYFLANITGCIIRNFGNFAIDGALGSWLWNIYGNVIDQINGYAVYLNQPNNAVVDRNFFGHRNKGDILVDRGTAFSHQKNLHNFNSETKEFCVQFRRSNNYVSESNYMEEFGASALVNGGAGTYPYILEIDHFEPSKTRCIRNNFCQLNLNGGGLARFITLRKTTGQDFVTTSTVDIFGNNLSPAPPYFIYYEPPVGSVNLLTIRGVSARNDLDIRVSATSSKIYDAGGLLRVKGEGLESSYVTTLTSPVNNTRIVPSNCTEPLSFASNFFSSATAWRFDAQNSGEMIVAYQWSSAVAANFTVNFELTGNVFSSTEVRACTGTSGAGTFSIATPLLGNKSLDVGIVLKGGAGALCDSFRAQIIVK